jgi:hypothetical protein
MVPASLVLATAAMAAHGKDIELQFTCLATAAAASPWTWTCNPATTFCSREPYIAGSQQQQVRTSLHSGRARGLHNLTTWIWNLPNPSHHFTCDLDLPPQGEAMCRLVCAPSSLLWPLPTSLSIPTGHLAAFGPNDIATTVETPRLACMAA